MDIAESEQWWYWPSIWWEQDGIVPARFGQYPDEYEALWTELGGVKQDGENVTRGDINGALDTGMWTSERVPEGYLRLDDGVISAIASFPGNPYQPVDGPEPTGQERVKAMLYGYIAWQSYRLCLAEQASKLTQFGRRG